MKEILLDNGMRIAVIEMPHLHSCEVGVYIGCGSLDDPTGKEGIAHLVEHMIFRGTKLCPKPKILDAAFESIGGGINACTDQETTCYHSRIHPKHLDRGIELLASMMLTPLLKGFATEKKVVITEIKKGLNRKKENIDPQEVVNTLLWPNSKLGVPVGGYLESLKSITQEDMIDFIDANYSPKNAILCISGAVKAEDVFSSGKKHFGAWSGKLKKDTVVIQDSQQSEPKIEFVSDPKSEVQVCLGFRGAARNDENAFITQFLRYSLSANSGQLFNNVRNRKGLVYEIYAESTDFPTAGALFVNFTCEPQNVLKALDESLKELWLIKAKPMEEEELLRFKDSYIYELDYSQDSDAQMHMRYGYGLMLDYLRTVEEDRKNVASITSGKIHKTANMLFKPENLNMAVIGPMRKKEKEQIAALVANYI